MGIWPPLVLSTLDIFYFLRSIAIPVGLDLLQNIVGKDPTNEFLNGDRHHSAHSKIILANLAWGMIVQEEIKHA